MKQEEMSRDLLKGAIDVHLHTAPDIFERRLNDVEAAQQAKNAGMKAIVIKNHITMTADRAQLASTLTDFSVFGGIVLNYSVGGLNRHAVEKAIRFGAKEIWMPTINAANYMKKPTVSQFAKVLPKGLKGISLLDHRNELVPDVEPILNLIAEHDVILATGHISVKEGKALVEKARDIGVKKILITHPHIDFINYPIEDMKQMVKSGAVLEHCYDVITPHMAHPVPSSTIASAIKIVGAKNCIMSSDGGQKQNPPPTEMLRLFIQEMLKHGLTEREIRAMTKENPAKLLGIK
jgi:hypothetical protein